MTKSKTLVAALAALTLATAFSGQAQAGPHFGHHHGHGYGLGVAIAAGTLIGIAAATSGPTYVEPAYADCRYVGRYDRWGNLRTVKVCDVEPY